MTIIRCFGALPFYLTSSAYLTNSFERGTHMTSRIRGISSAGIIGVIVVIAVVGVAVAYFGSDVFRTRANSTLTQFTQWTPENIAKDPVNYLNFCEEKAKGAIAKCKASEIAIAQKKAKIESMRDDARQKSTIGGTALDELKGLYKSAQESDTFPIKWKTIELDKDAAKRQILKLAGQTKSKSDLLVKLEAAIGQLRMQSAKLAEAKDAAQDQLAKIDTNREMLKVQEITDDIKNNLIAMKVAIETTVVGVANSEPGTISLDDLAAQSETVVDDSEFNKILNEK